MLAQEIGEAHLGLARVADVEARLGLVILVIGVGIGRVRTVSARGSKRLGQPVSTSEHAQVRTRRDGGCAHGRSWALYGPP